MLYFDSETALAACVSRATSQQLKNRQLFEEKKLHPDDLAGGISDLEMTWLLYCAGASTVHNTHTRQFSALLTY